MATFNAGDIQATASLDRTPFQRSLDAAIREGRRFDGMQFTAQLDADYRQVDRKLSLVKAKLQQFAGNKYTAKLDIDRSMFARAMSSADADLKRMGGGKDFRFSADLNSQPVLQKLQEIENAANRTADSIGSGFTSSFQKVKYTAIFSGITLGATAAAPALASLVAGLGVVGSSAAGVGAAVKAYAKEQKDADKVAASGAAAAVSNAIALRNAQQQIGDARRNQARVAVDAQRRIAEAERQEIDAARDLVSAQKRIETARREATRALQDAIDKAAGWALSQEAATVAVMRAEERRKEVFMDGASTDLDKREAVLNLAEAQHRMNEILKEGARDQEDAADAVRKGVEGSDQVVSAKEAERDAQERLADTQRSTSQAYLDAARSQEDAARGVDRALQGLADVQAQQAASAGTAAAKSNEFAEAMEKLSPAGQKFVRQLLAMKAGYDRLSATSQGALFPGMTRMLQAFQQLEPEITAGFREIGGALSDTGDRAASLMQNPVFKGDLVQAFKAGRPIISAFGDSVIDLTGDFVKFGASAMPLTEGVGQGIRNMSDGFGEFFLNMIPKTRELGSMFASLGTIAGDMLGGLGTLTGQVGAAWAKVRDELEPAIQKLIDLFLKFTGEGLGSFAEGMEIVLGAVGLALDVLEPLVGFMGDLGGKVLAAYVAFKLFAGPVGAVVGLFSKLAPTAVAAKIYSTLPAFARANTELDKTTGKVNQNADAANRGSVAWGKVGGAAVSAGKNIPLIGVAVAALAAIWDQMIPSTEDMAKGFLAGGQAAKDAADKISTLEEVSNRGFWDRFLNFGDNMRYLFGPSMGEAAQKARELYNAMSPLEQAQSRNTKAQNDYEYALKTFGAQSSVTKEASEKYKRTTQDVAKAQWDAEQATRSHTEKIRDQQDAMVAAEGGRIGYERSLLRIKEAQQRLTEALAQYKPGSDEVKQAQLDLEQAMLDSVSAAASWSDAQTQLLDPASRLAAHTDAVTRQLIILATQAGSALPPELQKTINKMGESELAAYGVTVTVDEMGNKILSLPPGKSLSFPTDASQATRSIHDLAGAVDRVSGSYKGWMDSYLGLIQTMINNPMPDPSGMGTPSGYGFIGHRAGGGSFAPKVPTMVGEIGPELVFPDRASFVATHQQSKDIMRGFSNGSSTVDMSGVESRLAALESLFLGGLHVTFDANSLETGLILAGRDRDRR